MTNVLLLSYIALISIAILVSVPGVSSISNRELNDQILARLKQNATSTTPAPMTYTANVCNPTCANGGICLDSRCFCSGDFLGKSCELKVPQNDRVSMYAFVFFCIIAFIIGILLALVIRLAWDYFFNYEDEKAVIKKREVWSI